MQINLFTSDTGASLSKIKNLKNIEGDSNKSKQKLVAELLKDCLP